MADPKLNKTPISGETKTRLFNGGADTDSSEELLGASDKNTYIDAFNTRVNDKPLGIDMAAKTIRGEVRIFANTQEQHNCVLATNIGSKLLEFWAPANPVDGGIVTIDGQVMVKSDKFKLTPNHDLQFDINNDALGGEIYFTDNNIKPMYFSIKDIIDNFGVSQKYFADFNPSNYEISLIFPPESIIFEQNPIVSVGVGGGLPVGQYSYSHRFVTNSGERTNASVQTPLIFVPKILQSFNQNEPYACMKTIGDNPAPNLPGSYGVRMKLRVDNSYNHDFIEIIRTTYNGGEAIDFRPQSYIVKRIPLDPGQFNIIEFVDSKQTESDEAILLPNDANNMLTQIKRAKAIRYFYNKVVLANIEYESRDPSEIEFLESANGNTMAPILRSIGKLGNKDPYNHAYSRGYMHGEVYGFYLVCFDYGFLRSLSIPIPGFEQYQMPNKRDPLSQTLGGDSATYSKAWSIQASTRGQVEKTFEVVDYKMGTTRTPLARGANILNKGNDQTKKGGLPAKRLGYRPHLPNKPYNMESSLQYSPVESISIGGTTTPPGSGSEVSYNPWIYQPNYNSLGMALVGIDNIPDWASSFSIVRTKKAGRVICQGMGFWSMRDANVWTKAGIKRSGQKYRMRLACHFPDIENGVVSSAIIEELKNNPTQFRVQLVEPLGFTSEVYSFRSNILNNIAISGAALNHFHADSQIDMLIHAAGQAEIDDVTLGERRVVNGDDAATDYGIPDGSGNNGYTAFGIWRNQPDGAPTIGGVPFNTNGNYVFGISNVFLNTQNEENKFYLELELSDPSSGAFINIYNQEGGIGDYEKDFGDNVTKNFTEPVYILNLIRDGAKVQDLDFQNLIPTGTHVKVRSVVGYSDGTANQSFKLCGERWEDCGKLSTSTEDVYVWVELPGNGEFVRYINIMYLSLAQIAVIEADIANGTTIYNGQRLYGLYTSSASDNFTINFGATYIPEEGMRIEVRYDNRFPVEFFGGDSFIGQANFPLVHRANNSSDGTGDENGWGTMLKWQRPMPYFWQKLKEDNYIIRNCKNNNMPTIQACDNLNPIYGVDWCKISAIRQMVILYNCQSYTNLALSYQEFFPNVNYVQRPTEWDSNKTPTEQNIYPRYEVDYPNEKDRWQLGGFRINQFFPAISNLDYSKENISELYQALSQTVFKENNYYPTRIAWSNTRPIQVSLAPNLKTFSPFSVFDISSNRGQIQRLYAIKNNGENLYAGCEDDWCIVLTRKRTLTDLSGGTLGVTGGGDDSSFIQEQIWMNEKDKGGLKGEFWKTFAENSDSAFFANYNGVFCINGDYDGKSLLKDISGNYYKRLYNSLFSRVQRPGQQDVYQELTSLYNFKHKEYWICFKISNPSTTVSSPNQNYSFSEYSGGTRFPHRILLKIDPGAKLNLVPENCTYGVLDFKITDLTGEGIEITYNSGNISLGTFQNNERVRIKYNVAGIPLFEVVPSDFEENDDRDTFIFVFSDAPGDKKWLGVFEYFFDKYCSFDNRIFGSKYEGDKIVTYELDNGFVLNGTEGVTGRIWGVINPELVNSYVFRGLRINSNIKPQSIKFYNVNDYQAAISELFGTDVKNYHGFFNLIPRDNGGNRNSNTRIPFQIVSLSQIKDFFVNSITFEYFKIK